jgi:trimethylamine--corrinoid protein Co-methyltransferase
MMHAIVGQLGRLYDIPTYGTGGCTDANTVDAQAGLEAMCSNMLAAFGGTNLTHDNGYLGAGLIGSLEMILLDSEIVSFIKRITDGIEVSEETLCLDLIHEVGPGGAYITQKHTLKNFKNESFIPSFLNRTKIQRWRDSGGKTLENVLNERVREIIEAEAPVLLSPETVKQYEIIIEQRRKEIEESKFHRDDFRK